MSNWDRIFKFARNPNSKCSYWNELYYMGFHKNLGDTFTTSVASKRDGTKPLNVFSFALVAGGDWTGLRVSERVVKADSIS